MSLAILIYSLGPGGAERITSLLLESLSKEYPITLVLLEDICHYKIPSNVTKVILGKNSTYESGLKKLIKIPILAYKYSKIIRNCTHSFSLMTRPNYINILASFFTKKPKIFISERSYPSKQYGYGNLQSKINRFLIQALYKRADKISANSPQNLQDLILNFQVPKSKTTLLPNCFDLEKIQNLSQENTPLKEKILAKKLEGKKIFVSIGRLDEGKNHALLINTLAALKDKNIFLFILGEGVLRESLQKQINVLKLTNHIALLGATTNPYAPLSCADFFLFGSNHEGFPNVLVESLALGIPIITTDCAPQMILQSTQEMQNFKLGKCGITTPLNNKEIMIEAIHWALENPDFFKKDNLLSQAKTFSITHQLPLYKKWLELE